MSTDDSISEDVSSSGALSHCHVCADGDGGKESETSLVSSEGTSASGLAVSEGRRATSQTTGGTVESRPVDITPACDKIRSLCLSTDEAFEQGRSLPFINPSSLETLRALVQEIQSSGETNPEIWKDCEGRWLHLFQLVEKQYQEQILAQQEQYQCQIQLIQDEIKALVQLQNRQANVQPHTNFPPTSLTKTTQSTKDYIFPLLSSGRAVPKDAARDADALAVPARVPLSSPSPPLQRPEAATVLSSGYGTLSTWETAPEPAGEDEDAVDGREEHHWSPDSQEDMDFPHVRTPVDKPDPSVDQQRTSGSSQMFTSWAQRHKLRPKKSKAGQASSQTVQSFQEQNPPEGPDPQDQQRAAAPSSSSFPLRRTDSLMSEASGLTYWRLNENELYHQLPDSFDSGAYLLLQEASSSLEPRLSLREIYQNKQRTDCEGSVTSSPSSPQVLTLDPAANQRQSDRTSGFTSPSRFSSPSFAAHPRVGTPATPDSTAQCSPNPGDTDCVSDVSSVSAPGPSPSEAASSWRNQAAPFASRQRRASGPLASEEEEGSRTHTSTLKPRPASGTTPRPERASSVEDPVVLSLLRQNLREKHSRHVADLKAYYESEIQVLRDKLKLSGLPQDLERSNQALTARCQDLEKSLAEASRRIQDLEAANGSLKKLLADWPERYAVAGAAVKSLQQRLEESKRSGREKDAAATRLKARVRQLEESAQSGEKEAQEREASREREHRMLQDLLGEYDSLVKEHEGLKKRLVSTESKLVDSNDQIADLRRIISKLEVQVKQLEHQNQARARLSGHNKTQLCGAGLFHHPDLLLSPSKAKAEPDVTRRKSPCLLSEQLNRKSPQTPQSGFHKASRHPANDQSSGTGGSADASPSAGWMCASPPECEQSQRRDASCSLTPMMRALIELEETRATQSRAPWVGTQRTTVGFVERRLKEAVQERVALQADREERGGGGGAKRAAALLKPQRSLSPEGHRSSSLPPEHRHKPSVTPTKRGTLLTPVSAKSSPKRCPTENYSTAFGHLMPREEHLHSRMDGNAEQRRHSLHSSSPRKKLQFTDREDDSGSLNPPEGNPQLDWAEQGVRGGPDLLDRCDDSAPPLLDRLDSLAEAEKLFDELTQEKLQVEAALSRMPGAGGRVTLQTRLDEVALEKRLDRLNRELGSIRMTLKRFHVLRSSANV